MPRAVQPLGTYGKITTHKAGHLHYASTRYRGRDGAYHRFQASDETRQGAINGLKAKIAAYAETGSSEDLTGQTKLSEVGEDVGGGRGRCEPDHRPGAEEVGVSLPHDGRGDGSFVDGRRRLD